MLFTSLGFIVFFVIVVAIYYVVPKSFRWVWLLGASGYFYKSFIPKYLILMTITILVAYVGGLLIEISKKEHKKYYFAISVIIPCLLLFFFKYFNFFNENLAAIAGFLHWNYSIAPLKIIFPLGISFYTFQIISYIIEVYRGDLKAERHLGIFSLYISFFPQLIAGPIEKPQSLLTQFRQKNDFDYSGVTNGLKLMAWGMFKKVVVADRLAAAVGPIFSNPHEFSGINFIMAAVLFTYQIYCDFSGYSDIAVGAGQVLGIKLTNNFARPFYSASMTEFWRRWHITLGRWLYNYVFTPIAIKRRRWGIYGVVYALMITFSLCGLWHGASWNYVVFGVFHGLMISLEAMTRKIQKDVSKKIPPTLLHVLCVGFIFSYVSFSFIFFRAANMNDALYIIGHIFSGFSAIFSPNIFWTIVMKKQFVSNLAIAALGVGLVEIVQLIQVQKGSFRNFMSEKPAVVRWAAYYSLIVLILLFSFSFGTANFIYFQF